MFSIKGGVRVLQHMLLALGSMCVLVAADVRAEEALTGLEEVVVTGSRIPSPNASSSSPIQVVTAKDIQAGGKTDISDVIDQLPQNFGASMGQDLNNRTSGLTTAGGVATADLRGLGPNRTLVLVNGRRLGAGSPNTAIQSPAPDLDQIPAALVERVDVVTGGASATYGSDAIAGVVNFIMKKDFEGLQVSYQKGEYWHSNHSSSTQALQVDAGYVPITGSTRDGRNQSLNIVAGTNFPDRNGNLTAYFSYRQADPVRSGDRDYGGCQLNATDSLDGAVCGGSTNSNQFRLTGTTADYSVVGDQFVPFGTAAAAGANPPGVFNSQRFIYMARADQRYSAGFMGHLDLNDYARPYFELAFMNDRTNQEIAPSALFKDSNPLDPISNNYNINCSNPLLSAQQASILCTPAQIADDLAAPGSVSANVRIGRRNVEGGGRQAYFEHTNYRAATGLQGTFAKVWNYDAYAQYYYTQFFGSNDRYLNFQSIGNALQVTGTATNPQCISGAPCVPYNIFTDGGVTADQLGYLYLSGTAYGTTTQRTIHGDVTADLGDYHIKSPLATEALGINIGYEHRSEKVFFQPDSAESSGLLSGFGGAQVPINNDYSVNEEFVEVRAPIVQERPGVKDLTVAAGFRRSDYTTAGVINTHKFEIQYEPIEGLRLRGAFQRAIRAPSIVELFNPQVVGQIQIGSDPCAATLAGGVIVPATATLAQCQNTGVTAAQYGNGGTTNTIPQGAAGQLTQLQGGNPHLTAEKGDSLTFGVSFKPRFAPGLSGSVDYYRIKVKDEVGALSAGTILQGCLTSGDPTFCSQLVRSNVGGLTGATVAGGGYIVQTNVNIGAVNISGVDLQGAYRLSLSPRWGMLGFSLNGVLQQSIETTQFPGAQPYDCAGLFGPICGRLAPKWRHFFRTTWETPWSVDLTATWRYIGGMKLDNNDANPALHFAVPFDTPGFDSFNAELPSYSYLDLAASWNVRKGLELRGGINNLFDKDPPIVTSELISGGAANSYENYDGLGRELFFAITAKF